MSFFTNRSENITARIPVNISFQNVSLNAQSIISCNQMLPARLS